MWKRAEIDVHDGKVTLCVSNFETYKVLTWGITELWDGDVQKALTLIAEELGATLPAAGHTQCKAVAAKLRAELVGEQVLASHICTKNEELRVELGRARDENQRLDLQLTAEICKAKPARLTKLEAVAAAVRHIGTKWINQPNAKGLRKLAGYLTEHCDLPGTSDAMFRLADTLDALDMDEKSEKCPRCGGIHGPRECPNDPY